MKDGNEIPNSLRLMATKCSLSGKTLLSEIGRKQDVVIRIRGKNRTNTCVVLKSALEEILNISYQKHLIKTSKEDFEKSLVSFVLPIEILSSAQRSALGRKFSGEYRKVFY